MEALSLEKCEWKNTQGKPCIIITKTPNTTFFDEKNINKININKEDIINSGAVDVNDVLKIVNGLDGHKQKTMSTTIYYKGGFPSEVLYQEGISKLKLEGINFGKLKIDWRKYLS